MAKKKQQSPHISQEDNIQAQQIFERYHHIARQLRAGTSRTQLESALSPIMELSETAQLALLKTLAKERHADSADVLLVLNEMSPLKEVRKEAKRCLIQLQGAKISPELSVPVEAPALVEVEPEVVGNAPRFWKGNFSDSRDVGEVQLILAWEQGRNYKDVRVLGFLLEFWHDGVRDFFTKVQSKTSFENFMSRMTMEAPDVSFKSCSLAEGRRLLLEALEVNKKRGTQPHRDYRLHQSLVNELILENMDIEDGGYDDDEPGTHEGISLQNLNPDTVVGTFVECWVNGEFDIAYDLLAGESPLREGLSREEWVARREEWLEVTDPGEFEPGYIIERKPQKSKLWLPNSLSVRNASSGKVFEASWSIEMEDAPPGETLPEFTQPTAVYVETGRHWFWASFSLVQDQDQWRIQNITDETGSASERPPEELRASIEEHYKAIEDITRKHKPTDKDATEFATQIVEHMLQAANYSDALIKKEPDDPVPYQDILSILFTLQLYERSLVYLEPLARLSGEGREQYLRSIAAAQQIMSKQYFDRDDEERGTRFLQLAEQALIEALSINDNFEVRISLAEVLIELEERLDEAEVHLERAGDFATTPEDISHVALHLGEIAMLREEYDEAVRQFQRTVDLQPTLSDSWADLASAYEKLGNLAEAESNYRHAIQLDPYNEDLYHSLSTMFVEQHQRDKAIAVVEEGLSKNPDSVVMNIALATMYMEQGDYSRSEHFMGQAEQLDPDSPYVKMFSEVLKATRQRSASSGSRPGRKENPAGAKGPIRFHKPQKKKR